MGVFDPRVALTAGRYPCLALHRQCRGPRSSRRPTVVSTGPALRGHPGGYGCGNTSHNFSGLTPANGYERLRVRRELGNQLANGHLVYGFASDFSFSSIDGSFVESAAILSPVHRLRN